MGAKPIADYCRQIESHLCQKNDGHLIRIVGPSFEIVSRWEADGVPLKIAFGGIDRYFERYYRKGPRRRPVRIDFCDADVRDAFDEWRRAVGVRPAAGDGERSSPSRRGPSLPAHLERALLQLTNARVAGTLSSGADDLIDRVSRELDVARLSPSGLRGEARRALVERLAALDRDLLRAARHELGESDRLALESSARDELAAFRDAMPEQEFRRACEAAVDRLVRERFRLPTLTFT